MDVSYQEVYTMNTTHARHQLVQTYLQTGSLARTAQLWQTSRQVVRKWACMDAQVCHQRSLVETVISVLKRKYGAAVSSRIWWRQELVVMCLL